MTGNDFETEPDPKDCHKSEKLFIYIRSDCAMILKQNLIPKIVINQRNFSFTYGVTVRRNNVTLEEAFLCNRKRN